MKKLILVTGLLITTVGASASPVLADEYVNGYYHSNGTYVQPYYRSSPNGNPYDNYSTRGNVNPYTGVSGTQNPYSNYPSQYSNSFSNPYSSPYYSTPQYQNYMDSSEGRVNIHDYNQLHGFSYHHNKGKGSIADAIKFQ